MHTYPYPHCHASRRVFDPPLYPPPCSARPSFLSAPPCPRRRPSLRTPLSLLLPLRSLALPTPFPCSPLSPSPALTSSACPHPCLHPCSPPSPFPDPCLHLLPLALTPRPAPRTARGRGGRPPPGGEGLLQPARRWRLLPSAAPATKHAGQPAAAPTLPTRQASHTHAPHPNLGLVVNA